MNGLFNMTTLFFLLRLCNSTINAKLNELIIKVDKSYKICCSMLAIVPIWYYNKTYKHWGIR